MGKRGIHWIDVLPPRKFVPIMSVRCGKEMSVRAAGPPLVTHAHFFDGQSSPCWGVQDVRECKACKTQKPRIKGFLPAYLPTGARRIVELTEGALRSLSSLSRSQFLGSWFLIRRAGTAPNSPLLIWADPNRLTTDPTVPFDVAESVEHMWGLDGKAEGIDSSYPQGS